MSKRFFFGINSGEQRRYRNGYLMLGCGMGPELRLLLALGHDPMFAAPSEVAIDVYRGHIVLPSPISSNEFDIRAGRASVHTLIAGEAKLSMSGMDRDGKDGWAGTIVLNMSGFSDAYAKLYKTCNGLAGL
jgi:hypothetical protein